MTDIPKNETPQAEHTLKRLEAALARRDADIRNHIPIVRDTNDEFDAIIKPRDESTESAATRPSLVTRLARLFGYKS